MKKSITVNIPKPCHEDWNKMTPRDKDRHCSLCQKTVVDFTNQSDEQIIKHISESENTCGRFKNNQLNRQLVLERKENNSLRNWVAAGLFSLFALTSAKTNAQEKNVPKKVQIDNLKHPQVKGKVAQSVLKDKIITGTVTALSDGLPLPGVNILVKGTSRGLVTDFDGNYTLKVRTGETLVFSYVGFNTTDIKVEASSVINLTMEEDNTLLGETVIVGYIISDDSYYREPYLTHHEREERIEKRKKRNMQWRSQNREKRLALKAERLTKKQKRREKRESKKE